MNHASFGPVPLGRELYALAYGLSRECYLGLILNTET